MVGKAVETIVCPSEASSRVTATALMISPMDSAAGF
jgi:hypothetical protein